MAPVTYEVHGPVETVLSGTVLHTSDEGLNLNNLVAYASVAIQILEAIVRALAAAHHLSS